jgi:hypothetical protein
MDIWGTIQAGIALVAEEQVAVVDADSMAVGETAQIAAPALNALVIKGHNGKRIRITGVTITREA